MLKNNNLIHMLYLRNNIFVNINQYNGLCFNIDHQNLNNFLIPLSKFACILISFDL